MKKILLIMVFVFVQNLHASDLSVYKLVTPKSIKTVSTIHSISDWQAEGLVCHCNELRNTLSREERAARELDQMNRALAPFIRRMEHLNNKPVASRKSWFDFMSCYSNSAVVPTGDY